MATTTILNDLIDLNQTGNTTALKGCVGTNAQQPATPTISVQYLVVGGGGGGGSNGTASGDGLGGGGAGGLSTGTIAVPNNTAVNIVIGQGGLGGGQTSDESGTNGQDSGFYQIQGQGGGGGGEGSAAGFPGGSGGGGGRNSGQYTNTGTGVSDQGNNGGIGGYTGGSYQASSGGGGGGKGSVGAGGGNDQSSGGAGGSGYDAVPSGIITQTNANTAGVGETNGAERNFAGGGGGGQANAGTVLGGSGGGGNGGANSVGSPGTANTGGGGGGDGSTTQGGGGTGGSGVVILKYANTATETIAGSLAGGITTGTTSVLDYPSGTSCVALYEFESNGDSTSSASNNQTTVGTLTYSTGNFNNAVSGFSGSNYFQTAGLFDTMFGTNAAREISFSVWIKTSSSNYQGICGAYVYSAGAGMNLAVDSTGKIRQQISAGSTSGNSGGAAGGNGGPYVDTQATVNDGNWHHVVVTYKSDGTTSGSNRGILNQYIDGVNVTSSSTFLQSGSSWTNGTANPWSSTSSAFFTGTYDGSSYHFEGEIDQLRLYTTQLTDSQVAMLYAENIGATKFTESSDTVLVFKGGSGTINLTDTSLPGPKVGDLRTNTDQSSANSASAMEHYMSTGWRIFDNYSTLGICNYPTTATSLYQLEGPTVTDTCGNYPGTIVGGVTFAAGKFGNALDLTTSSTYVELQGLPSSWSNGPCSLSVWVYMRALTAGNSNGSYIFSANGDWRLQFTSTVGSGIKFVKWNSTYSNNGDNDVKQSAVPSLDTWYHVVVTDNQANDATGNLKLYINGTLADTNDGYASVRAFAAGKYASIGASGEGRNGINGQIDQLRLFPSVLTAAQVTELYNET